MSRALQQTPPQPHTTAGGARPDTSPDVTPHRSQGALPEFRTIGPLRSNTVRPKPPSLIDDLRRIWAAATLRDWVEDTLGLAAIVLLIGVGLIATVLS